MLNLGKDIVYQVEEGHQKRQLNDVLVAIVLLLEKFGGISWVLAESLHEHKHMSIHTGACNSHSMQTALYNM